MHGINYSLLRKKRTTQPERALPPTAGVNTFNLETNSNNLAFDLDLREGSGVRDSSLHGSLFKGMRNLLPVNDPTQLFGHRHATEDRDGLMARLSHRLKRGARSIDADHATKLSYWPDKLPGATNHEDNPAMPAGYTYLLQLIAHDVVASSLSFAVSGGNLAIDNARLQPMLLETLYGSGPEVDPRAYEYSELVRAGKGEVPRTRLRVGKTRDSPGDTCPFNDIARARTMRAGDSGLRQHPNCLTEALIADPRNDDHALISQLALLFHRLHNEIICFVDAANPVSRKGDNAHLNFLCARAVVTLIYRQIILHDVLKKLLHPDVYAHYVDQKHPPVTAQDARIPLEFAVGAFRCGHAMLRNNYHVNKDEPLELKFGLDQSTMRDPDNVPITGSWVVEWKRFFHIDETPPNLSRRLGPNFAGIALDSGIFPPLGAGRDHGLPMRDLLSSSAAGLWSVPALIDELRRDPELANILPPYGSTKPFLKAWLEEPALAGTVPFQDTDIADLTADPPLPFYILFEAACTKNAEHTEPADPFQDFNTGGQHLGPLGSTIVAESIVGLLRETDFSTRKGDGIFDRLGDQIDAITGNFGLAKGMFSAFHGVRSMSELLKIMLSKGIITQ